MPFINNTFIWDYQNFDYVKDIAEWEKVYKTKIIT